MKQHSPTYVDLFSGCGGFSLGAELSGFKNLLSVDIDSTLQSSYLENFPNSKPIIADVANFNSWKNRLDGDRPDLIIGGPPCQGFSRIGKGNLDDPRRNLLLSFFYSVQKLKPTFFVMENVEGLLDKKNVGMLEQALKLVAKEYTFVDPFILDSSILEAPTKRKRVFVIGYLKSTGLSLSQSDFIPHSANETVTVRDAIYDLGSPIFQHQKNEHTFSKYKALRPSKYAKKMRAMPPSGLGNAVSRRKNLEKMVTGHIGTNHTREVADRFSFTKPGKTEEVSRFPKLSWTGLCPTLRAGTGKEKGGFQSVRPIHPEEPRVITPREAARLQGFPDWFFFHSTKWHSFRMIGNSVSPIVATHVLSVIYKYVLFLAEPEFYKGTA